jgi:hypothetical protein
MAQQSLLDETAATLIPLRPSLKKLRDAATGCKACPLWKSGTQTVFGEGSPKAEVISSASSPATRRTRPASRSSGLRAASSTRRWMKPASTARSRT